jgi:hypothetical protein
MPVIDIFRQHFGLFRRALMPVRIGLAAVHAKRLTVWFHFYRFQNPERSLTPESKNFSQMCGEYVGAFNKLPSLLNQQKDSLMATLFMCFCEGST